MKSRKFMIALIFILVLGCAGGAVFLTSCGDTSETAQEEPAAEPEPEPILNPLTGQGADAGFDENAINQRVVAFVVENAPEARPQWGMDSKKKSPDIILQGEVEGGITRTLWLYADYNKLPKQIGPMRSARPPFIKFSECFDAIFIHWGMSHSSGDYHGASSIFKWDEVDHIDQMSFADEAGMYDRDHTRNVNTEHTGIVYGSKVPAAIEEYGCRTEPKEYTKLNFNETAQPMSDKRADEVRLDFSDRTDWETYVWTYDEEDGMYHTDNFDNNLVRDNLLILFDETEYITKSNYQGPGGASSVTYTNYKLKHGKGKLISQGTVKNIKWKVVDHIFYLIDADATKAARKQVKAEGLEAGLTEEEIQANLADVEVVYASLNPGKTWIGWASENNGGEVEIIADEPEETETDDAAADGAAEDGATEDGATEDGATEDGATEDGAETAE